MIRYLNNNYNISQLILQIIALIQTAEQGKNPESITALFMVIDFMRLRSSMF